MSNWNLGSKDGTLSISLTADDENGNIQSPSTAWFQGIAYPVTGRWVASAPGRAAASAFSFSGETPTVPNPLFLAASGIMVGPGPSPTSISLVATKANSADSRQEQYQGELLPNQAFTMNTGGWVVTLDDGTTGVLSLSLASGGFLNSAATWTYPSGGSAVNVFATWVDDELSWWGSGIHYGSGVWNPTTSTFTGSYIDRAKRKNGTWTASQGK